MPIDIEVIERQKLFRKMSEALGGDSSLTGPTECTEIAHTFAREYAERKLNRKPDNPSLITGFMQQLGSISRGGPDAYLTIGSREYAAELYRDLVKLGVPT